MFLQDISESILTYLQDAGIDTRQIDYKEIVDRQVGSLQRPAVNISINAGTWEKVTMDKSKLNLTVSLLILVQNIKGEKERRFDAYNLMESIATALFIISMDLELQDLLKPMSFANVTDNRFADAGYQLYQMNFSCSYIYEEAKEDLGLLRDIVNNYTKDDEIILTTTVDTGYWGGSAAKGHQVGAVFGGKANTEYWHDAIWGGYSGTTYNN